MTRTSNWLLKTTFVLAAIATFLAVSFGETLATLVTVHQSTEDFYSNPIAEAAAHSATKP